MKRPFRMNGENHQPSLNLVSNLSVTVLTLRLEIKFLSTNADFFYPVNQKDVTLFGNFIGATQCKQNKINEIVLTIELRR